MALSKAKKARIFFATLLGPTIEWYDFFLYGTAASLVFGTLFFPKEDPTVGLLLSYATFGVAFIARPLGSIVFSHLGDKVGRKQTLIVTLTGMGLITVIIGLLPGYQTIGVWGAVCLTVLRFLQGIAIGGEWGGAVVYMTEHAPKGKRGLYGSIPQMGIPIGLLLSTGFMSFMTNVTTNEAFLSWGWRIPFVASIVLVAIGVWIRSGIPESHVFLEQKASGQLSKFPIADTIKYHWASVLKLIGCKLGENAFYYIITTYVISFATTAGYSKGSVLTAINIAAVVAIFSILGLGYLSDFVGRRALYIFGSAGMVVFAIPYYYLSSLSYGWLVFFTIIGVSVIWASMNTVQASLYPELFPTNVRYTGASLGQQVAAPLGGGLSPIIAAYLYAHFHSFWALSGYMIFVGLISLVSALSIRDVRSVELNEVGTLQASEGE
jgi:metabolite-proton symporter